MSYSEVERRYLEAARVGRLATVDSGGRPHAVPVCYALVEAVIYTPLDEKPQEVEAADLRRVRNIRQNPAVTLVVDHYTEDWEQLGWVQVRGTASLLDSDAPGHEQAVASLQEKYAQYETHDLTERLVIRLDPGSVVSWGRLDR